MKKLIEIISEEVESFDFLRNEENQKEQEIIDLIKNEDLQKQFICDSLINKNKIKIILNDSSVGGNWNNDSLEDADTLTIDYNIDIEYKYDSNVESINFNLNFYGANVRIAIGGSSETGDNLTPPSNEAWFYGITWNDIEVSLFTLDGDKVKFLAFERAPKNIQSIFTREMLKDYIENQTSIDIRDKFNGAEITRYC